MIIPEIKVDEDIILECSNLDHQIQQKILYNFEKKSAQSDNFYRFYGYFKFFRTIVLKQLGTIVLKNLKWP